MDEDRWEIQWVRDYKQFVVNPPVDFEFEDDFWESLSFNSIREAMNWIEEQLIKAPVANSLVAEIPDIPVPVEDQFIPPYQSRRDIESGHTAEPVRVLQDSERMRANRYGVVNPIADQIGNADTRRDRLEDYQQSVGLN